MSNIENDTSQSRQPEETSLEASSRIAKSGENIVKAYFAQEIDSETGADENNEDKYAVHRHRGFKQGREYGELFSNVKVVAVAEVKRRLQVGRLTIDFLDDDAISSIHSATQSSNASLQAIATDVLLINSSNKLDAATIDADNELPPPELPYRYVELAQEADYPMIAHSYIESYNQGRIEGLIESINNRPNRQDNYNKHIDKLISGLDRRQSMVYEVYRSIEELIEISKDNKIGPEREYSEMRIEQLLLAMATTALRYRINRYPKEEQ